jgi:hypothetical protein
MTGAPATKAGLQQMDGEEGVGEENLVFEAFSFEIRDNRALA